MTDDPSGELFWESCEPENSVEKEISAFFMDICESEKK